MFQRYRRYTVKFILGLAVVLGWSSQSMGLATALITAPSDGTVTITRTTDSTDTLNSGQGNGNGGGNLITSVTYECLREGNSVKFENAPTGLGEDGAAETDIFEIAFEHGRDCVEIYIKAGTVSNTEPVRLSTEYPSEEVIPGFTATLTAFNVDSSNNGTCTVTISSENAPAALSNCWIKVYAPPLKEGAD